jgi:hypothetical protein
MMKEPHFVESGKFDMKCSAFNMPLLAQCSLGHFGLYWGDQKQNPKKKIKKRKEFFFVGVDFHIDSTQEL